MNELIQQLALKAGMQYCYNDMYDDSEFDYKKFAELIVMECADFLKDTLDDHFAAEQLEEHFGVEE